MISVVALSPTVRATFSDFLISEQKAGSEAGGPEDRSRREAGVVSQAAGASAADAGEGAVGCPAPSLEVGPAWAASGATFRLSGHDFSAGCDRDGGTPTLGVRVYFLQAGETWNLATLDAGRDLTFSTRLRVPASAEARRATVQATTRAGERVERRFLVLR